MDIKFEFIGHCFDKKENHDKVWGAIRIPDQNKVLTFWGRRGKKLQTLIKDNDYSLFKLIRLKEATYQAVDVHKLQSVYPEFQSDLEKTTMWAILLS